MNEKPFWVVWNPKRNSPQFKHDTRDQAVVEAKRLAQSQPGDEFFVLKASLRVRLTQPFEMTSFEELPW